MHAHDGCMRACVLTSRTGSSAFACDDLLWARYAQLGYLAAHADCDTMGDGTLVWAWVECCCRDVTVCAGVRSAHCQRGVQSQSVAADGRRSTQGILLCASVRSRTVRAVPSVFNSFLVDFLARRGLSRVLARAASTLRAHERELSGASQGE
jgi:hypothetical protein